MLGAMAVSTWTVSPLLQISASLADKIYSQGHSRRVERMIWIKKELRCQSVFWILLFTCQSDFFGYWRRIFFIYCALKDTTLLGDSTSSIRPWFPWLQHMHRNTIAAHACIRSWRLKRERTPICSFRIDRLLQRKPSNQKIIKLGF